MVGDRDLLAFRQGYYDLFVSLLWKEPSGELLAGLAEGIAERIEGGRSLHPSLGAGWEEIGRVLTETPREQLPGCIAEEYTRLFIGPVGPEVNPYESYYLTGRLLDRPLVTLRGFLKEIGLEKQGGYAEPEDSLVFELEVMRRLIARQGSVRDADEEARWINSQAEFLKRHLLVWASTAASDLAGAKSAVFYRAVAKLLQGFLSMEEELFKEWGPAVMRSLQEARQGLTGMGEWRGPVFDPSGTGPEGNPAPGQ